MTRSVAGRVVVQIDGKRSDRWTALNIERDLRDIAGRFDLEYRDAGRAAAALPGAPHSAPVPQPVGAGQACSISIDGERVMTGWIDIAEGEWTATSMRTRITGRDKTGDLADCAAAPNGPAEWRNATLLQVAQQVAAPFGVTVRAETDIGAPFERLAVNPHESALSLLEKAARQRSVLLVSDGIGGLLLTTGGDSQAPAAIVAGRNAQRLAYRYDWSRRYSDIYVKGQSELAAGGRVGLAPAMTHDSEPTGEDPDDLDEEREAAGIRMTGHAVDPAIKRWRPIVKLTRTQSGAATQQQQAEWWARVLAGEATQLSYTLTDWRAGGKLWKPNTLVRVTDPWAQIDDVMLIRKVTYRLAGDGPRGGGMAQTVVEVVGRTAFDRTNEAARRRPIRTSKGFSNPNESPFR